jgi:6-phosphogluconolactonase
MREIRVTTDTEDLFGYAAETFVETAREAIGQRGIFTVALSGGSTPKGFYHLLTTDDYRTRVDWKNVRFFFGDERFVPPAAEQSNFRMALQSLFKPLAIDLHNIFRWKTEISDPKTVARQYEQTILENAAKEPPYFDLFLLGMGPDGHVASLFPSTKALTESQHLAVPNWVEKLKSWRLTMTYPVINNSRNVMFLVAGEAKADAVKEVLEGKKNPDHFPAQSVRPKDGRLMWFLDEHAAKYLKHKASSVHN